MTIGVVNERSAKIVPVAFIDANGDPVTPTAATYRVDDVGTGTEVRGDAPVTDLDEDIEILLEAVDTVIIDASRPYETREWMLG